MASARNKLRNFFVVTEKPPHIYLESLHLAQEIRKYPVIFDLDLPERNLFSIFGAWENVIASLIPCFRFLDESDKAIIRRNLRRRWTVMRKVLTDDVGRKRPDAHRNVSWVLEMQFMVPLIYTRRQQREMNKKTSSTVEQAPTSVITPSTSAASSPCSFTTYSQFVPSPTSTSCGQNEAAIDELHQKMIQTFIAAFTPRCCHSQTDSDKNFLFGLLQIFRKIQPRQKEELKQKIGNFFSPKI